MKLALKKGATSVRLYVFVLDSTLTTGAGKTGIAYNAASLVAYYVRPGAAAVAITLATQTVTGAYSSGGWVEVDATNMPGVYRFDVPDAAHAAGVDAAVVMIKGATGMAPVTIEVQLTDFDLNNAAPPVDVTKWNGTAVATPDVAGYPKVTANVIRGGTAQAGAAGTVTLDAGASATSELYNGNLVAIMSGTGVGQSRMVKSYAGATKIATISPNWTTNPDATSVFVILPLGDVLNAVLTEAYGADGAAFSVAQALYEIAQSIGEFAISGTTITMKKRDGATSAGTYTLDSASTPTSRTRST